MTYSNIKEAVQILNHGGLVAFPTETVYGLGADAASPHAVQKIFSAKKRPANHPLIVHIGSFEELEYWAKDISQDAFKLAHYFWPGPLTLILKKQPHVLKAITGGQDTIGLRMPNHPIAKALLNAFGSGIAAPSANLFTHVSPTDSAAVRAELGGQVDLILEGGACELGLESTILDMSRNEAVLLRPGMIQASTIEAQLGRKILYIPKQTVRAPGQHHVHYAPQTKSILMEQVEIKTTQFDKKTAILFHTDALKALAANNRGHWVLLSQDPMQYARDLYRTLRACDTGHFNCMIIESVPHGPSWDAIRDRLKKAAG